MASTLRSFSFQNDERVQEHLEIFSYLVENPSYKCDFCFEIIEALVDGRIDLNQSFNLPAYANKVERILKIEKENRRKRFEYIDDADEDNQNMIEASISSKKDEMKNSMLNFDYNLALKELKERRDDFLVYDNVEVFSAIKMALEGIPDAVSNLQRLCNCNNVLRRLLYVILNHGVDEEFFKIGGII